MVQGSLTNCSSASCHKVSTGMNDSMRGRLRLQQTTLLLQGIRHEDPFSDLRKKPPCIGKPRQGPNMFSVSAL